MTKEVCVVLVGCGCPKRSMGWYHAEQILAGRIHHTKLQYVVEPFYMTAPTDAPGYSEFHAWKDLQAAAGIPFYSRVCDVPPNTSGDEIRMTIISARTGDNPRLLKESVANSDIIYLEKPGAPTVDELKTMRDAALANHVTVYMGFNKNVSSYVTRSLATVEPDQNITFLHNNNYKPSELPECFERNAEGMLKNMAIHELAILVTFFGVTIDTIQSVEADKDFSSCRTLKGASSDQLFTDFDKLKFKITTKSGHSASVAADRCGGDDSVGIITDQSNTEVARFVMPDDATVANIPNLEKLYPGSMPYFYVQDPDYCEIKNRIAEAALQGTSPKGVATIDTAIETLALAEYLTPILVEQLK